MIPALKIDFHRVLLCRGHFQFWVKIEFRDIYVALARPSGQFWVFSQHFVSSKALHFPPSLEKAIRFLRLELL